MDLLFKPQVARRMAVALSPSAYIVSRWAAVEAMSCMRCEPRGAGAAAQPLSLRDTLLEGAKNGVHVGYRCAGIVSVSSFVAHVIAPSLGRRYAPAPSLSTFVFKGIAAHGLHNAGLWSLDVAGRRGAGRMQLTVLALLVGLAWGTEMVRLQSVAVCVGVPALCGLLGASYALLGCLAGGRGQEVYAAVDDWLRSRGRICRG